MGYAETLTAVQDVPKPGRYAVGDVEVVWGSEGLRLRKAGVVTTWTGVEATSIQLSSFRRVKKLRKKTREVCFLAAELRSAKVQLRFVAACNEAAIEGLPELESVGLELPFSVVDNCLKTSVGMGALLVHGGSEVERAPVSWQLRQAADVLAHSHNALTLVEASLGLADLDAFLGYPELGKLRRLNLRGTPIGDDGAKLLARCAYLSRLEELKLPCTELGNAGAGALAASPHLRFLEVLVLRANPSLGDPGVQALAASPYLKALRTLNLGSTGVGDLGVEDIAKGFGGLEELVLSDTRITAKGLSELVETLGFIDQLHYLNVANNALGDIGLELLQDARVRLVENLHTLDISGIGASQERLIAFVSAFGSRHLVELGLSHYPEAGDALAEALASNERLPGLGILRLRNCGLTDHGARALLESPNLTKVHTLDLRGQALSPEIFAAIRERLYAAV